MSAYPLSFPLLPSQASLPSLLPLCSLSFVLVASLLSPWLEWYHGTESPLLLRTSGSHPLKCLACVHSVLSFCFLATYRAPQLQEGSQQQPFTFLRASLPCHSADFQGEVEFSVFVLSSHSASTSQSLLYVRHHTRHVAHIRPCAHPGNNSGDKQQH